MAQSEKKDGQAPGEVPVAPDAKESARELAEESLDRVAGGMGVAVPQVSHASLLKSQDEPCCLG